jgi:Domain of unknown function (DUF1707)/Domain of unknown function (DUF4190)
MYVFREAAPLAVRRNVDTRDCQNQALEETMPLEPGHGMLPSGYDHIRASTADRERVVDVVKTAFTEGRLTQEECGERVGQALSARTYGELAALTADLPAGPLGTLVPQPPHYASPSPRRPMNRLAVASLVISLMPVIPVLAVFTGLIAHAQIQERGERGAALATAGIVIGGFVSLLFLLYGLR